ncbi:hypothetical protein ACFSRY_16670 [Pontibacter locisalis]|uniref:PE-PGRS family protein n=1 Tax=Pontibacter locisalis TaxID=1719035 RepID=A0ABW5IRZ2_9BACT
MKKPLAASNLLFLLLCSMYACKKEAPATEQPYLFEPTPLSWPIEPTISGTSGLADSKTCAEHLWVQEDGGSPTQLILLGYNGQIKRKMFLKGVVNRDWEELQAAGKDLFIADIGDNKQTHKTYTIYQFQEPSLDVDTVTDIRKIEFMYPDGSHDAEAFIVDPITKEIFILTKRDNPSRIYKLPVPFSYTSLNKAIYVGNLPYNGVVGAALSANGKEILLKTYTNIFYYTRPDDQPLLNALQKEGKILTYQVEPQGEAVAFTNSNSGFYTLSEQNSSSQASLYFYRRK